MSGDLSVLALSSVFSADDREHDEMLTSDYLDMDGDSFIKRSRLTSSLLRVEAATPHSYAARADLRVGLSFFAFLGGLKGYFRGGGGCEVSYGAGVWLGTAERDLDLWGGGRSRRVKGC